LSNSICVEPSSSTPNPVRIIPDPAGLVQRAKLLKENVFILDPDGALMSTQEYMQKVVEDVGEDADFNSGAWVSATNYVNAFGGTVTGCLGDIDNFLKKGKLEQVVAIVKSCSPNALGDLNVTLKDLSGTVPGTIHYKVLDVGSYEKDITVGAAMILANVSVFTPKPSKHYLNITKRNVVEVFRKDTVGTWAMIKSLKKPCIAGDPRPSTGDVYFNRLTPEQRDFLECEFSKEDIKRAVWDCGGDQAPSPDGFRFKFFKTFWDFIQPDVVWFVREFFQSGYFPKGCNSSFITLIPKVSNAKFVSEFRSISLLGCQYEIVGKLLANTLSMVIGSCVSVEQSAFIKGRNILDGPLLLIEYMSWYHKRKKDLMVFKVDFEKAYDSLRWD
ncbi:hypothetical protein Tco_0396583, partial [Tanacetum coccineum]